MAELFETEIRHSVVPEFMMAGYFESMHKHFQTYNKTKEYQVHSAKVHSVAWNCDGKRLASGSFDKTVVTFVFDRGDRLVSSDIT